MIGLRSIKTLIVGLGIAGISSATLADGMPRGSLKDAPIAAPFSWTGMYVGVNAGYSWGKADSDTSATTTTRTRVFRTAGANLVSDTTATGAPTLLGGNADVNGWLGGAQIGYNLQLNNWVVGVETDFQWSNEKGNSTACLPTSCAAGADFATAETKLDWFGTLRARAGLLVTPTVLLYATGGLAYGHVDSSLTAGTIGNPATSVVSDKSTKLGWVAGGGVEAALNRNWLVRAEYLYMDLGEVANMSQTVSSSTNQLNTPQAGFNTQTDSTTNGVARTQFIDHIFRVGLNYKFN